MPPINGTGDGAISTLARSEPPRPLFRKSSSPDPYPVDKMGPILAPATEAIIRLTQAPAGICANSVLAAASLATQALADVKIPGTERAHPLSLYLLTIAESGERKTTADREALVGVKNREAELREAAKEEITSYRNGVDAYDAARAEALKRGKGDLAATRQRARLAGRGAGQADVADHDDNGADR